MFLYLLVHIGKTIAPIRTSSMTITVSAHTGEINSLSTVHGFAAGSGCGISSWLGLHGAAGKQRGTILGINASYSLGSPGRGTFLPRFSTVLWYKKAKEKRRKNQRTTKDNRKNNVGKPTKHLNTCSGNSRSRNTSTTKKNATRFNRVSLPRPPPRVSR